MPELDTVDRKEVVCRCKAPLAAQGEGAVCTGNCDILTNPLKCKKCLQQVFENQRACEHQSEMDWKPGGPELNLRAYTESPEYHGLSSDQLGFAYQGNTRRSAVSGTCVDPQ